MKRGTLQKGTHQLAGVSPNGASPFLLDCWGLLCPMPVRKTAQTLESLEVGQILHIVATDEWFGPDLEAWLRCQPHELLCLEAIGQEIHAYLRKRSQSSGDP